MREPIIAYRKKILEKRRDAALNCMELVGLVYFHFCDLCCDMYLI